MTSTEGFAIGAETRKTLETIAQHPAVSGREALRARIVLMAADGATTREIADRLATSPPTVALWRRRFSQSGVEGLQDRPRPGRPRAVATRSPAPWNGGADDHGLEALLAAAARTISRRGFASTRVADIAAEAGVSSATVHYHFRTREEVLVRAMLWASARMLSEHEDADAADTDPVVRLARLLGRMIPYPGVARDEYLLEIDLWSQVRAHPALLPIWERYEEEWLSHVTELIAAGVAAGAFRCRVPAAELAERLVAMTDGLSAQAAIGADRMPPDRVREIVLRFAAEQLGLDASALEARL
jgi:AcrR family transcriptional regulator